MQKPIETFNAGKYTVKQFKLARTMLLSDYTTAGVKLSDRPMDGRLFVAYGCIYWLAYQHDDTTVLYELALCESHGQEHVVLRVSQRNASHRLMGLFFEHVDALIAMGETQTPLYQKGLAESITAAARLALSDCVKNSQSPTVIKNPDGEVTGYLIPLTNKRNPDE